MSDQKQLHRDTIWLVRAFACPVCHSFTPFEADRCGGCGAAVGLHLPTRSMLTLSDGAVQADGQRWIPIALDCNRVNTAMGKKPLYPFTIPPPVAAKLGFVHRVVRETSQEELV